MKLHRIIIVTLALFPFSACLGMKIEELPKKDLQRDIVFYEYMIHNHPTNEIQAFKEFYPHNTYKDNGITITLKDNNFEINIDNEKELDTKKAALIKNHHFKKFVANKLLRLHLYYPNTPLDSTISRLRRECVNQQKACILIPTSGNNAIGYNYYKNTIESFLNNNEITNFLNNKDNEPYNKKFKEKLLNETINNVILGSGFMLFISFLFICQPL